MELVPPATPSPRRQNVLPPLTPDLDTPNLGGGHHWNGGSHRNRYQHDLENSITRSREELVASLHSYASALFARYQRSERKADLDDALKYHAQGMALASDDQASRIPSLLAIAPVAYELYKRTKLLDDLNKSIDYHREIVNLSPGHAAHHDMFANVVFARYKRTHQAFDLGDAIDHYTKASELFTPSHDKYSAILNALASALQARYRATNHIADLNRAIDYNKTALESSPKNRNRATPLIHLANAIITRYRQSGSGAKDLGDAIDYYRQALELCPGKHYNRPLALTNLASAVHARFRELDSQKDLSDAIEYYREALELDIPGQGHSKSATYNNLGSTLHTRYRRGRNPLDLKQAIEYFELAVKVCPESDRAGYLNNLGSARHTRYKDQRDLPDLQEAISCYERALMDYHNISNLPLTTGNLASALVSRFRKLKTVGDLERAITLLSQVDKRLPDRHPARAETWVKLAFANLHFSEAGQPSGQPSASENAFQLFEKAATYPFGSAQFCLSAALEWAKTAQRAKHGSALKAYMLALNLLDRCLIVRPTAESQQRFLADLPRSLASDAAACALEARDVEMALGLLEQGRGLLWTKLLGYRHPLDQLRLKHRDLADTFEEISFKLEGMAISPADVTPNADVTSPGPDITSAHVRTPSNVLDAQTQTHIQLREEWDRLLKKIRELDGFKDFLLAVPFTDLQKAGEYGPVIVINVSEIRSDAIILYRGDRPSHISIDTHPEDLARDAAACAKAQSLRNENEAQRIIFPILRALWKDIVNPVVDELGRLGVKGKSRVWWCPTSALCGLPLHAAGMYDGNHNFADLYISSYTPTITTLIRSRSHLARYAPRKPPRLLAIGQPQTLPGVHAEIEKIKEILPSLNVLSGDDATLSRVVQSLRSHPWAHFACHGLLHRRPFDSSFELSDGRLTLLRLIEARLPNAEFAFLSACDSAAMDMYSTPDEVIHLASALQFCGFRSVVGTLWAMEDADGAKLAGLFYENLLKGGGPHAVVDFRHSAEALNKALKTMRQGGMSLKRWIKYVHIGA